MFKLIENLDNYFVLSHLKNEAVIGVNLSFKEYKESKANIFQPSSRVLNKELPIFFLVCIGKKPTKMSIDFAGFGFPVLWLTNKNNIPSTGEEVRNLLNDFVSETFRT
jgi:hypothetical protein